MGLFQQRPEEHRLEWAGLPSEPRDPSDAAEVLDAASDVDPSAVHTATTMSVVFPVAPPVPEARGTATAEPES